MPDLISMPFMPVAVHDYDPYIFSYGIGQECQSCRSKIIHHQSISVCQCHRYCHKKCFLHKINEINLSDEATVFRCTSCHSVLGLEYRTDVRCKFHINQTNTLMLLSALCFLPLTLYVTFAFKHSRMEAFLLGLALSALLIILILAIANSFFIR